MRVIQGKQKLENCNNTQVVPRYVKGRLGETEKRGKDGGHGDAGELSRCRIFCTYLFERVWEVVDPLASL